MTNAISAGAAGRQRGDFTLEIDDQRASELYAKFDMASPLEQEQYRSALRNWAEQKVAQQQSATYDELQKVYEDVGSWWKDSGGNDAPDEVRYGAANRKFIAAQLQTTAREMGDLYPTYRDQWFLKTFRKQPKTETEAFNTIRESLAAEKQVNQSYDLITGDIALALFDQVNKGTPVDVPSLFTKWKEENAEILSALPDDWEANALKAAGQYYAENEKMLREHGGTLQRLYGHIVAATGRKVEGAPEDDVKTVEDLNAIIDELGQLPQEVRQRGYTAILMAARRQGMEDKGFWEMAAEAWPRTLNTVRTTGLVAQETDAEAKVNLLRGDNPIFINKATGQVTPPSGTAFSPQDFEPVTDEQRGELLQQAETELQRFNVIRELRDLADGRFDPVKSNAKNGVLKFVQDIALMGPQSLGYTAMAAVPVAGPFLTGAAIYADEYNQLRLEGMSSSQARTLAAVSAPLQTAAEVFGAKLIFGRYKWYRETIQKLINPARFARSSQAAVSFFGKVVGENITEGVQDLTTPLVKDVASALSEEYPDVNWEETLGRWKDSRLEVMAATLMPVIGGSLVETFNNNERFASARRRVQLLYKPMGITDEEVRYIEDGTTPEERTTRYTETLAGMSAERVQAVKDNIASQSRLATGTQEDATRPTLETQKDASGRLTYIVRDETGKEVYRSTKQAAAEEAFILTSARSTAARFNEEKVQLRELVEWWNTADPKRADNEERVVRDTMQGTAQQKLEALQQANNKQGIEELHRRIAQSPYAGTPYDQIQILGEASVEQVGEMVFRSVIALNKNSRVRDAREEMHHTAVRMAVANGRANEQTMREWLDATERVFAEKGLGITLPRADMTDIVESMAVVQEAFENERISADVEMSLPQAFVDYIKRMIQVLAEVLKRGKAIREALDAGALPAEFEAFLVETTGVADQTAVDRARERTEQEVGAQQNYSIGLREPSATSFNETTLPDGNVRFIAYHGSEQPISQLDDRPIYVSSLADGAGYGDATRMVIEGRFLPVDEIEAFAAKYGIAMEDLFHEEASMEQDLQEALRSEGYDGAIYYDQRRDDGDVMPAAVIVNPQAIRVSPTTNYSIAVPSEVDEAAVYDSVLKLAGSRKWDRGRDLKMAMQEAVLSRAQAAGVDVSDMSPETKAYLVRVALRDALFALKQNPNAIGWYDIKTRQALAVMALIHPEIGTDKNARFAFTWILAVTSNGLKVDMNFDLAEQVYRAYKKKKVMPTNVGIGTAGKAINNSLKLFNRLAKEWGIDNFRAFTQTTFKVSEISSIDKKLKPSGEFAATEVRGAAIAGPKIGNGFFSNLNGFFDALTMDRWLIRTWGRWTGTLIKAMPEQTTKATERLQKAVEALTSEQASELSAVIGLDIPTATMPDLAQALAKASMDKEIREALNNVSEELRKAGNSLAKYLDGQKEAPSGPAERNNVREIFKSVLDELRATEEYKDLTMADLQAVLWYAEKRLYESAKEDFVDDDETEGYADDEAPDYANAAAKVARDKGVSQARISKALTDTANVTTGGTRPPIGGSSGATGGQQGAAGGFTEGQKRLFRGNVAVRTVRRGRGSNAAPSWSYSREGSGDGGSVRVLKKIAVKYAASYKAGRDLRRVFRNNGIEAPRFVELVQDEANAQRFAELITSSKKASKFGAAVYVYPVSDYQGMRLFLSEDGTTGFALKSNGDIVSVFSTGGAGHGALELAVAEGGTRLDAFDTILPDYYSSHGFVAVSRLNWDDSQAPDGWDKALYKEFNKGEPDVVFMAHQPSYFGWYSQNDGTVYTDYNDAVDAQDRAVADATTGANISTRNYSISTQSEIDRVQAAMGALDRSPLSRIKVYEKMQERFLRVMADNRETLAAMEGGDLSQVRRTQILQALGELDGIISALPAEIRSKIGGYTQLAKVDPMDVFKGDQKVSEVRGMSGAIISAWMREGLNIGEAQKKTELPAGYRAERNLDPTRADRAIADVFIQRINRINEALEKFLRDEYNDAAVELFKRAKPQRSGAGEKPKGKLGADVHALFDTLKEATEWSAEEAQAWADGQWARIEAGELNPYEEAHATLAAQVIPLFADWANADSTQRAAAVAMGKDILDRAYKGEQQRIIAQRTKRGYDRTDLSKDAGVSAEDDKARQNAVKRENSLPSKWEAAMLNLLNFDQVLRYVFGNDSKIARQISDRQRKADNAKSDDVAALSDEWATFLSRLGGGEMQGQQLLFDLSRMDEEIDGVAYSQNQLVAITMMWMQPKGRQHMEGFMDSDGQPAGKWHYNQAFVNKAEKLLRPESKAIRQYLLRKYDEEYEAINKVYRKVYGLNLPKNQFYSPLVVESIAAPAQAGIDPVTGGVFAAGANSPSALRSRGGAIAQPVFRDAVQTYFGHMLQMAHWKAYAEFNSEVSALLGHRDTRNVVKGKAGEQAATVMNNWLQYFQQGGNKDAANHLAINQWINRITGNFAAISLFGRISTLALQVTQLGAASAKMPVGAYLSRFGKLMSGRLKWTTALDSDYIQRRIKDMPPAVALAMQGLRAEKPSQIRNAARWLGQHLSGFDGLFTAGTYAIVYDYQLSQARQNGMGGQEAADYAREATERIVDEIAQPTRAGARSIYELNATNPVARAVWAFSSESRKNMGLLMASGAVGGKRNFGKALTYVLLLNGLVGIVIRNAFRDMRDEDDEEIFDEKNWGWKRLAAQFISDPIYGIPVVGETIEGAIFTAFGVYQPSGSVFDVARGVPAAKRMLTQYPAEVLEGEAEFRDIVADVNRILATAGLFNSTIAGAASISNLAKDVFEIGDNALRDE